MSSLPLRGIIIGACMHTCIPDLSRQGQARNSDLELWSGYDLGLPTGPVSITKSHLKCPSFQNVLLECAGLPCVLSFDLLSDLTWDTFLTLRISQGFYSF